VRVQLDQAAIQRLFSSPAGPTAKVLARKAIQVQGGAQRLCPVDTGRLRSSITHRLEQDGIGLVAYVGTNVEYAIYVELGTSRTPAEPFLRPALRAAT
jgi:HK97 gp10 family phage protein